MQHQQAPYPQPPKLGRPASVISEPSTTYQAQQDRSGSRPRSQSHTVYSNYLPPPSASPSAPPIPSNASSKTHEATSDIPVRFQKSKLSKQYTPSEEDSDEESGQNDVRRRSKFLSGAALELNSNNADSLRALSRLSVSPVPSRSSLLDTDSASIKSAKKKVSLGKRISRFFGAGGSKSSESASSSAATKSSASSIIGSEKLAPARSSTTSLAPIDELVTPPSRAHGVYMHQRSFSTPDQIGDIALQGSGVGGHTSSGTAYNAKVEEVRLRKARDSGFEEAESKGHRRHSSSFAVPRGPPSRSSSPKPQRPHSQHSGNSSNINNSSSSSSSGSNQPLAHKSSEAINIDSHQHHHAAQQAKRSTYGNNSSLSTSSPQLRVHLDRELRLPTPSLSHTHRHSFVAAELAQPPSPLSPPAPSMPRRSSAPIAVSETLISKVDRETSSVCFQVPNAKKEIFTKDAHLDPVLSNLVQQHRKDFKTNQRLGGTPQPHSPLSHQGGGGGGGSSPRMRMSAHMEDYSLPPIMLARDPNARRDSSGSQHLYSIHSSGLNSPQSPSFAHPPSPGLYASEAQTRRLSTSSQHQQQQQQQHPYLSSGQRTNFSGSQGSLHQYPAQSQGQHSPRAGPQRTAPQRLSSTGSVSSAPLELSLQMQQHQQLEQLQQMRLQQQQLLLHQQQQLQQQLQQTRVTVAVMQRQVGLGFGVGAIPVTTPMYTSMQQQQQQQQQMYMHPSTMMAAAYQQ